MYECKSVSYRLKVQQTKSSANSREVYIQTSTENLTLQGSAAGGTNIVYMYSAGLIRSQDWDLLGLIGPLNFLRFGSGWA